MTSMTTKVNFFLSIQFVHIYMWLMPTIASEYIEWYNYICDTINIWYNY